MEPKYVGILLGLLCALQWSLVTSSQLPWRRTDGIRLRVCSSSMELGASSRNIRNRTGLRIARFISENFQGWMLFESSSGYSAFALEGASGKLFFITARQNRRLVLVKGSIPSQISETDPRIFRTENSNNADSQIVGTLLYHVASDKYVGKTLRLVNNRRDALEWCW